jgi:tRNA dimethylallyltransferase
MSLPNKIPIVAVVGPTASGKTALSIEIAKHFGGEIIGADSMQIYKNMSIASAAPTSEEKGDIPHHLFEFLDPSESFSVAEYVTLADKKAREITSRGKLPILVGGTGLYVDSFLGNLKFSAEENTAEIREKLEKEAENLGTAALLERLKEIDPEAAAKLHENDKKRIIRALEVYSIHGITPTEMNLRSKAEPSPYKSIYIGATYKDRELLYKRIEKRVYMMVEQGLLQEAEKSYKMLGNTAVQAIGHKEFYPYFDGEISKDEAIESLIRSTRRYAKRQLTWFRRNENINWIYMDEDENPIEKATEIVTKELK